MQEININSKCPFCNKAITLKTEIPEVTGTPKVRGGMNPVGQIMVYRISTEQIKDFLIKKARHYVPDVSMTIVPRYCEKKRKRDNEPHRSYASLRIAFSEHIIEKKEDTGWFGSIGDTGSNVRIQSSVFKNLIEKYQYNRKEIDSWLKNYKTLEELEDGLGMTEAYINDLRMYATPQRIKTNANESWIIFSAAAENVIADMLTEVTSGQVQGRIQIQDVYPISKEIVEFIIYVHPAQMKLRENPHVRQILLGEEKPKK